jgi:DNA-directed RNA polymerase specialized sigma24 family protein
MPLDDELLALAKFDERKVRIAEWRHFGGLSLNETATAPSHSVTTIGDEQRLARARLRREMETWILNAGNASKKCSTPSWSTRRMSAKPI